MKNKSSIGRAVVAGIVLGFLGAIIGGMSGIWTKNMKIFYLVINYWDINNRQQNSIFIACKTSSRRVK